MIALYWAVGIVIALFMLTVLRGAPYVPTRNRDIDRVFDEVYRLQSTDVLVDIGSGDGKICFAAAKRGARAIGYEINPILVLISRWRAKGVKNVRFLWRDFLRSDLPSDTTVVYVFGDSRDIVRIADWVERQATQLAQPMYLLSYAFELPGRVVVAQNKSHLLYEITPTLQTEKT